MPYRLSKTHKLSKATYLFAVAFSVVAGLVVFDVPFPRIGTDLALRVARPVWEIRDVVSDRFTSREEYLTSIDELRAERNALLEERTQLQRENYSARALIEENHMLKTLVGRMTNDEGLIPASVILAPEYSPYDTFIIDAGADMGVREQMLILTPEGVVLGYVQDVHDKTAVGTLFSAHGVRTDVILAGTSTLHVTLEGKGGSMEIRVPRDLAVMPDTPVIVPGFSGARIGTVGHIQVSPEDAFQTIYVNSLDNIHTVRHVLIDTTEVWTQPIEPEDTDVEAENKQPSEAI